MVASFSVRVKFKKLLGGEFSSSEQDSCLEGSVFYSLSQSPQDLSRASRLLSKPVLLLRPQNDDRSVFANDPLYSGCDIVMGMQKTNT